MRQPTRLDGQPPRRVYLGFRLLGFPDDQAGDLTAAVLGLSPADGTEREPFHWTLREIGAVIELRWEHDQAEKRTVYSRDVE